MNEAERQLKNSLSWTKGSKISRNDSKLTSLLCLFTPDINDYEIHEDPIGQSKNSKTYLARHNPSEVFVAMTQIDLSQVRDTSKLEEIGAQIRNWKLRYHPCLLTNFVSFVDGESLWNVCQLMASGSCYDLVNNFFPNGLEEAVLATILKEVLRAVCYLHEHSIIHNHIRSEHILLDSDGDVKLSGHNDITWMVSEGVKRTVVYDFKGEAEWMAPEIMGQDIGHDTKADIYSFGMTALELVNGRTPYRDWEPLKIFLNKMHKKFPPLQDCKKGLSKAFYQMVAACLSKNPAKRPTAMQLLNHPFFKLAKDKNYLVVHLIEKSQQIREEMARNGTFPPTQSVIDLFEEESSFRHLMNDEEAPQEGWEA